MKISYPRSGGKLEKEEKIGVNNGQLSLLAVCLKKDDVQPCMKLLWTLVFIISIDDLMRKLITRYLLQSAILGGGDISYINISIYHISKWESR